MLYSRRSLRRTFAFAAATLAVLTMFAVAPMIAGGGPSALSISAPL